jgi:sugar-specific transcriptional regulator TrmB
MSTNRKTETDSLSLKRVLEMLAGLGLNQSEAKIYVFLAKRGPHTGKDLCNALSMQKPLLYPCLRNLQSKGLVNATPERPATFSAISFEKVLDLLVEGKMEEVKRTEKDKEQALTFWRFMIDEDTKE